MTKGSVIAAVGGQVSTTVDDEVVILNLDTGIYFGLNPVGAWVWAAIQTPTTVARIHEDLIAQFDVDAETGERDLLALLEQLAEASLIEIS